MTDSESLTTSYLGDRGTWIYHLLMLGGSCAILIGSMVLTTDGESVRIGSSPWALPSTCSFRNFTGIGCPGCGLTRSFIMISRGDFLGAWATNRSGYMVYLLVVTQIPWRLIQLVRMAKRRPPLSGRSGIYIAVILATILLVNWVWMLIAQGPWIR